MRALGGSGAWTVVEVPAVEGETLHRAEPCESSATVRARVVARLAAQA